MKAFAMVVILAVVAGATEAIVDPTALINLKAQIGDFLVNKLGTALQAKQNLILSGTQTVLSAKQNLIQQQIPHLFAVKANAINSVIQLKRNLLANKVAQVGQIIKPGQAEGPLLAPPPEPAGPIGASDSTAVDSGSPPSGPGVPQPVQTLDSPALQEIPPSGPGVPQPVQTLDSPALQEITPSEPIQPYPPAPGPSQSPCSPCGQSTSEPVQFPVRLPSLLRPQPAVGPQVFYRPKVAYGPPPSQQPVYGPPPSHQSVYGPPLPPPQLPTSYSSYNHPNTFGPPTYY